MTSAIIFLCILYWISKSSDSVSALSKPLSVSSHNHDTLSSSPSTSTDKYSTPDVADEDDDASSTGAATKGSSEKPLKVAQSPVDVPSSYDAKFPRTVWQTANTEGRVKYATQSYTWASIKGFKYNFLTDDDANEWVRTNFASSPSIVKFWKDLQAVVLKADFLRYLIMLSQGGIYADIDTSCLAHPDAWIPSSLGASEINAIIGIEYDDDTYNMFVRPISFCQWTLMAKPNHPIFQRAVQRVMSNLEYLARKQRVSLSRLTLQKLDVLEATGPGMITDVVMSVLRDQGQNITWQTFHEQKEPKLYGDVLILPINGFAGSQKHSHAGDPEYGDLLVQHHFGRTWYKTADGKNKQVMSKEMEEEQKGKTKDRAEELKDIMDALKEKELEEVRPYKEGKKDDGKIRVPVPNAALQKTTLKPADENGATTSELDQPANADASLTKDTKIDGKVTAPEKEKEKSKDQTEPVTKDNTKDGKDGTLVDETKPDANTASAEKSDSKSDTNVTESEKDSKNPTSDRVRDKADDHET